MEIWLNLIHIETFDGSKYLTYQTLVDEFSGMQFTYFLKSKNEVFIVFYQFRAKYENLTGKRIKRLRTDNGLKFINEELDSYLANLGIFNGNTIPFSSEN